MRISELIALEWSDIDLENCTILVNKQFYRGKLTTTKTLSSIRRVSVPDIVIETLLQLRKQTKVLSPIVFCGDTGQYINTTKFVENWFKKAVRSIGKPDFNFHALRHTYATLLLSKSVSLKFVQEQLGHSTAQTTLNVYSHVLPSVNKKAMNILNNLKLEHDLSMGSPEHSKTALQSGSKWSG
jgi:integrase